MRAALLLLVLAALPLLSGCKQFVGSEHEDSTTFANYTISMVGQIDFEFQRDRSTLLRGELVGDIPEVARLIELEDVIYRVLQRIVEYSLDLVVIHGTFAEQDEQVQAFADYLEELRQGRQDMSLMGIDVDDLNYAELVSRVREQDDMLAALRQAQPLVYAVVRHAGETLDEIKRLETVVDQRIAAIIDEEASDIHAYSLRIRRQRNEIARALTLLDAQVRGDRDAAAELQRSPLLDRLGVESKDSSPDLLEELLVQRLEHLERSERTFESTYRLYERAHAELDLLVRLHDNEIRQIRSVLIAWAVMHQRMALGIELPATWYDLRRSPGDVLDLSRQLLLR